MLSLKFATVPVADQARALAWYTDKLGCSVIEDVPFGSPRWIELAFPAGGSHIVLFTAPGDESRVGTFVGLSFTADDIEQVYEVLCRRGVVFSRPLEPADWGGKQAIFQDSEGNQFVLAAR